MQIDSAIDNLEVPLESNVIKKCTTKDVLMGRGKRVSEWPGNKRFRQIVDRYRKEYVGSERHSKARIAETVIQEIYRDGGRFVREMNGRHSCDGTDESAMWVVVEYDRALEKTCQALRERDTIPADSNMIPSIKAKKNLNSIMSSGASDHVSNQLTSNKQPQDNACKVKKAKLLLYQKDIAQNVVADKSDKRSAVGEVDVTHDIHDSLTFNPQMKRQKVNVRNFDESDQRMHSRFDNQVPEKPKASKKINLKINNDQSSSHAQRIQHQNQEFPDEREMIKKLKEFFAMYGHTAVPSGWPTDMILADWCTSKRQIHRNIRSGYCNLEDLTSTQLYTHKILVEMNFCFQDYDVWHWNYQINDFTKTLNDDSHDKSLFKISDPYQWLMDQYQQNLKNPIDKSRIDRLENIGIIFH